MRQERVTGLRMGVSSLTWPESFRTGRELSMPGTMTNPIDG